jgi:hypothetical protein
MEARNAAMNGNSTKTSTDISSFTSMSQGLNGDDMAEEMGLT